MLTAKDWASEFGDAYTKRQMDTSGRDKFWNKLVHDYVIQSVVEVGCNNGTNLIQMDVPLKVGIDVNQLALDQVPEGIWTSCADATRLPLTDNQFDLAFTFGVLIHIPDDELEQAMKEVIRVSKRFVFCAEYLGDDTVPYRGEVLWRRPYGSLYQEMGLEFMESGYFEGPPWDRNRVDWWLFRV